MRIRRELGGGSYEYEKIPDQYKRGRGYLFRNGRSGIRLYEIIDDFEGYSTQDYKQLGRLLRLCIKNHHGKQRLMYTVNAMHDLKPVTLRVIANQLNLTEGEVKGFIKWCKERDYIRRDKEYKCYVVNPEMIMFSNRLGGREYWVYRDRLKDRIPSKYVHMLTLEALEGEIIDEGAGDEIVDEEDEEEEER